MDELREDYRHGLVIAISFCVFAMPILLGTKPEEITTISDSLKDANNEAHESTKIVEEKLDRSTSYYELSDKEEDDSKTSISTGKEGSTDEEAEQDDDSSPSSDTNDLEDEVDGEIALMRNVPTLPSWAKNRLVDGIMEALEN